MLIMITQHGVGDEMRLGPFETLPAMPTPKAKQLGSLLKQMQEAPRLLSQASSFSHLPLQ